MPSAWIHSLSKQQAKRLAIELGVSMDGILDDLRRRLKEKWSSLEPHLPSQLTAKSNYVQAKMRGRVVGDLVRNIPMLSGTDPESVLHFLIRAQEVYDLNLVGDLEFLALLVGRSSGRVTQILGLHLGTSSKWIALYTKLANEECLKKCIRGKTQNDSKALHSLIWNKCPKDTFISKRN
ncbi:hypothetical protein B7P43_G00738 [Cryptotermes secundus]|uniref:Uncharacterized protein n=1 Tax=Cryptotermes secundus TaxID=105785 RepID=A0A2J7Q7T4_9NEOP|nr:hypothetical protein B7P43_G00738 [Cryptotermes secundus]